MVIKNSNHSNKEIIINHITSNDVKSNIFNAIFSYFEEFSPNNFKNIVTERPIDNANIYHYHRPHLELKLKEKSVCTVHHDLNDPDPWHSKFNFIPRYNEATAIICLNNIQKKILKQLGISEKKISVIPHGYNNKVLHLSKIEKSYPKKIKIGIASRRYGRRVKGEVYLFELSKRLDPDHFEFILIGQDRLITSEVLKKMGFKVRTYERLPYKLFQSFYDEIDLLLMCSNYEGGPANIPEAIATGVPIFSSPIGMAVDLIKKNYNGIFLDMDPDIDALKITNICIKKPEIFARIASNARLQTIKALTWEEAINLNLSLYKKIIEDKN